MACTRATAGTSRRSRTTSPTVVAGRDAAIFAFFYRGPPINTATAAARRDRRGAAPGVQLVQRQRRHQPPPFFTTSPAWRRDQRLADSPHADEFAFGVSISWGPRRVRADFVHRNFTDFYADRTDTSTGR